MLWNRPKQSHGARAVVTGAGSGIGRAIAIELGRRGSDVICADLHLESAQETAAEISALGRTAHAVVCDVSERKQIQELAATAEGLLGEPVTLLVNNAGVGIGGQVIGEIGHDDWDWALGINLMGMINGCEIFLPQIKRAGRGGIINVSSAAAFTAAPSMGPYNVGKAGVLALSETLAAELAGSNLSVTALCPTGVKTGIIRNGRIGADEAKLAALAIRLIGFSPERVARMTLNGFDSGRMYVVPQPDAKLLWAVKRHLPRTYLAGTKGMSRLSGHTGLMTSNLSKKR